MCYKLPKGNRMPALEWIGKAAVIDHYRQVGYLMLRRDRELCYRPATCWSEVGRGRTEWGRARSSVSRANEHTRSDRLT